MDDAGLSQAPQMSIEIRERISAEARQSALLPRRCLAKPPERLRVHSRDGGGLRAPDQRRSSARTTQMLSGLPSMASLISSGRSDRLFIAHIPAARQSRKWSQQPPCGLAKCRLFLVLRERSQPQRWFPPEVERAHYEACCRLARAKLPQPRLCYRCRCHRFRARARASLVGELAFQARS